MIRHPALLLAAALIPAASEAQQASLTTSGGVARLDQASAGAVGALAAMAGGQLGPVGFQFVGNTVNYQSLGTANLVTADLRFAEIGRAWRLAAGPRIEVGSGVTEPWNHAWSAGVSLGRAMGMLDVEVTATEGVTLPNDQRVSFGRRAARAGVELGPVDVHAAFDLTIMRDSTLRDDVFFDPADESLYRRRVRQVRDASIAVAIDLASLDVQATLGRRSGDDIATQAWWRVEAALPIAQVAAVTFTTARNPANVVLGLRGGRATTLGLRLALPDESDGHRDSSPRVEVSRESAELVWVVFTLPGGSRARLMGEITGWRAVELESLGGGRFAGWFRATTGTYRVNVALDEGPWIAPPGMPRVEDGFGGLVGLLEL